MISGPTFGLERGQEEYQLMLPLMHTPCCLSVHKTELDIKCNKLSKAVFQDDPDDLTCMSLDCEGTQTLDVFSGCFGSKAAFVCSGSLHCLSVAASHTASSFLVAVCIIALKFSFCFFSCSLVSHRPDLLLKYPVEMGIHQRNTSHIP